MLTMSRNLIHSKKLFWFGSEPIELNKVAAFKADKVADVAHHVTAWASETGKGLLFFSEKDKGTPQGAIQLVRPQLASAKTECKLTSDNRLRLRSL